VCILTDKGESLRAGVQSYYTDPYKNKVYQKFKSSACQGRTSETETHPNFHKFISPSSKDSPLLAQNHPTSPFFPLTINAASTACNSLQCSVFFFFLSLFFVPSPVTPHFFILFIYSPFTFITIIIIPLFLYPLISSGSLVPAPNNLRTSFSI